MSNIILICRCILCFYIIYIHNHFKIKLKIHCIFACTIKLLYLHRYVLGEYIVQRIKMSQIHWSLIILLN